MEFPAGRSKNRPPPPRRISFCLPATSYARPKRGAGTSVGQLYVVLGTPLPDTNRPLVGLPEPGTSVPMATEVFGPNNWPVRGSIAWRLAPVQGCAAQPAP